jgi:hypothetical protein
LSGAGLGLEKPKERSFVEEGEILERGFRKALGERDEALRELAAPGRWVHRAAFKEKLNFGQVHQVLLKALDKAGQLVRWSLNS